MFELMRSMQWSWEQFEATPVGVREICWAFLMAERRVHNARSARTQRATAAGPEKIRVRR